MPDLHKFNKNIRTIEKYYSFLEGYSYENKDDLEEDFEEYLAISMALFTILNAIIEVGEEIIQIKELDFPGNYREIFEILGKKKLLSKEVSKTLSRYMHQRNMLAHQYDEVNADKIYELFRNKIIFKEFITEVVSLFK